MLGRTTGQRRGEGTRPCRSLGVVGRWGWAKGLLTDTLHGAANLGADTQELAEVPAWDLHHTVVQARLEVGRGGVGD